VAAALSRTLSDANGGVKIGGALTNEPTVSVHVSIVGIGLGFSWSRFRRCVTGGNIRQIS